MGYGRCRGKPVRTALSQGDEVILALAIYDPANRLGRSGVTIQDRLATGPVRTMAPMSQESAKPMA